MYLLWAYLVAIVIGGIGIILWVKRQEFTATAPAPGQEQAPARRARRGLQDIMDRNIQQARPRPAAAEPPAPPTKYEEKLAAREAARLAHEKAAEDSRDAQRKKEALELEKEYAQWKDLIVEEEKGVAEESDSATSEGIVESFVQDIKDRKMVALEDLAVRFNMGSAQECLDRVHVLESEGRLSGILDDRGKYVYISAEKFDEVAKFITEKGRVNLKEVVAACNRIIDVTPAAHLTSEEIIFDDEEDIAHSEAIKVQ